MLGKHRYELWNARDVEFLRRNYSRMTRQELANILDISISRVQVKITRLKLPKYSFTFQRMVVEDCKNASFKIVGKKYGVSRNTVSRWAKKFGVKTPKKGGRKKHEKLKGLDLKKAKKSNASMHRYCLLHIYNYTCYDCELHDPSGKSLQHHQNYDVMPVQSLILCKSCHVKRHVTEIDEEFMIVESIKTLPLSMYITKKH